MSREVFIAGERGIWHIPKYYIADNSLDVRIQKHKVACGRCVYVRVGRTAKPSKSTKICKQCLEASR